MKILSINFCSLEDIMYKKKIFTKYASKYCSICGTYKELQQINGNVTGQLNRKINRKLKKASYANETNLINS